VQEKLAHGAAPLTQASSPASKGGTMALTGAQCTARYRVAVDTGGSFNDFSCRGTTADTDALLTKHPLPPPS